MTKEEIKSILIKELPASVYVDKCKLLADILSILTWIEGRKLIEILNKEIFLPQK